MTTRNGMVIKVTKWFARIASISNGGRGTVVEADTAAGAWSAAQEFAKSLGAGFFVVRVERIGQ